MKDALSRLRPFCTNFYGTFPERAGCRDASSNTTASTTIRMHDGNLFESPVLCGSQGVIAQSPHAVLNVQIIVSVYPSRIFLFSNLGMTLTQLPLGRGDIHNIKKPCG